MQQLLSGAGWGPLRCNRGQTAVEKEAGHRDALSAILVARQALASHARPATLITAAPRPWPLPEAFLSLQQKESSFTCCPPPPPPLLVPEGFLAVNEFLQSDNGPPNVFGAGDIAAFVKSPRPKAGVFAVRAVRGCARRASALCA